MVSSQTPDFAATEEFTAMIVLANGARNMLAGYGKIVIPNWSIGVLNPYGVLGVVVGRGVVGV